MRCAQLNESWPATRKVISEMLAHPDGAVLAALTSAPTEIDVLWEEGIIPEALKQLMQMKAASAEGVA